MTDKERLEEIKSRVWKEKCTYAKGDDKSRDGYSYTLSDYDFEWLIQQVERVEELKKQLEQVKKASDFLLFQIGLARSKSLIKAEFSGEEELYKALEGEK